MPTHNPSQDFAFFCDESGISANRFVVVGGLCVHRNNITLIRENMAAFRTRYNMTKELKWSKVTDCKLEEYKHLVDYFFALSGQNLCHFKCIIFDSHQWRHHLYNDGDKDKGLSKLYYQLLHHKFCKRCAGTESTLYVRLDHRNSSTSLNDLRDMLNNAARRDHGMDHRPFRLIESADSKECDILQLNDVILGAVCHQKWPSFANDRPSVKGTDSEARAGEERAGQL